jgi:hypothetical protein
MKLDVLHVEGDVITGIITFGPSLLDPLGLSPTLDRRPFVPSRSGRRRAGGRG